MRLLAGKLVLTEEEADFPSSPSAAWPGTSTDTKNSQYIAAHTIEIIARDGNMLDYRQIIRLLYLPHDKLSPECFFLNPAG